MEIIQKYQEIFSKVYPPNIYDKDAIHPHLVFAYHAVYPTVITVDVLYQIWYNFRTYSLLAHPDKLEEIPFEAVNDFLHSGLCREVGGDMYRVDPVLRKHLLKELDTHVEADRSKQLALFLQQYSEFQNDQYYLSRIKEIHTETAEVSLFPEKVKADYQMALQKVLQDGAKGGNMKLGLLKLKMRLEQHAQEQATFVSLNELVDSKLKAIAGEAQHGKVKLDYTQSDLVNGIYVESDALGNIIQHIDRSHQQLQAFPEELFEEPEKVVSLDLSHNFITDLPDLSPFINLQYLNLDNNPHLQIYSVEWPALQNLRELKLTRLDLHRVPEELFYCPALEKLDLYRNQIQELPPIEAASPSLQQLDFSYNQLTELPYWIAELPNLKRLYLEWNRLEYLEIRLGNLQELEVLHLHANFFQELPQDLLELRKLNGNDEEKSFLRGLTVHQNAFQFPLPPEKLIQRPRKLLKYIFQQQSEGKKGATLYTLLIGIDNYEHYSELNGAKNDVKEVKRSLELHMKDRFDSYEGLVLSDEAATRERILRELQVLQRRLTTFDTLFFYFSGHSHYEIAPEHWFEIGEEKYLQGLSCYDSKAPGTEGEPLLSGIEINFILQNILKATLCFDTHYNGQYIPEADIAEGDRTKSNAVAARLWEEFVFANESGFFAPNPEERFREIPSNAIELYATSKGETAYEREVSGRGKMGYFSHKLVEILGETEWEISYADIQFRLLQAFLSSQTPQTQNIAQQTTISAESPNPNVSKPIIFVPRGRSEEVFNLFLQDKSHENFLQSYLSYRDKESAWQVDVGALDGLQDHEDLRIVIPTDQGIVEASLLSTNFSTAQVLMDSEQITIRELLEQQISFPALLVGVGLQDIAIQVKDDSLRRLLNEVNTKSHIDYTSTVGSAYELDLEAFDKSPRAILREIPSGDKVFEFPGIPFDANEIVKHEAQQIQEGIEHLSQWHFIKDLQNYEENNALENPIVVQFSKENNGGKTVNWFDNTRIQLNSGTKITITCFNNSKRRLFTSFLLLNADFSIGTNLLSSGGVWLPPQQELQLNDGRPIEVVFSEDSIFYQRRSEDTFLLAISSTSSFDPSSFELPALKTIYQGSRNIRSKGFNRDQITEDPFAQEVQEGAWITQRFDLRIQNPEKQSASTKSSTNKVTDVRKYLANDELNEAFEVLLDPKNFQLNPEIRAEIEGLYEKFQSLNRDIELGLISAGGESSTERDQMITNLLDILEGISPSTEVPEVLDEKIRFSTIPQATRLIRNKEIKEALQLFIELPNKVLPGQLKNQIILLTARYNRVREERTYGSMSEEEAESIEAKIQNDFINLLVQIDPSQQAS